MSLGILIRLRTMINHRPSGLPLKSNPSLLVTPGRASSAYKPSPNWKPPHLDELPVPAGSWKTYYRRKQRSYNFQLLSGVTIFVFTLFVMKNRPEIIFNFSPPPLPGEEDNNDMPCFTPQSRPKC